MSSSGFAARAQSAGDRNSNTGTSQSTANQGTTGGVQGTSGGNGEQKK